MTDALIETEKTKQIKNLSDVNVSKLEKQKREIEIPWHQLKRLIPKIFMNNINSADKWMRTQMQGIKLK